MLAPIAGERALAQQGQDVLGQGVGLSQHGGSRLLQDVGVGELGHLLGHIHIADLALGGGQVLGGGLQVVDLVLHAVLDGAQISPLSGNLVDGIVHVGDGGGGGGLRGDLGGRNAQILGVHAVEVDGQLVALVGAHLEGESGVGGGLDGEGGGGGGGGVTRSAQLGDQAAGQLGGTGVVHSGHVRGGELVEADGDAVAEGDRGVARAQLDGSGAGEVGVDAVGRVHLVHAAVHRDGDIVDGLGKALQTVVAVRDGRGGINGDLKAVARAVGGFEGKGQGAGAAGQGADVSGADGGGERLAVGAGGGDGQAIVVVDRGGEGIVAVVEGGFGGGGGGGHSSAVEHAVCRGAQGGVDGALLAGDGGGFLLNADGEGVGAAGNLAQGDGGAAVGQVQVGDGIFVGGQGAVQQVLLVEGGGAGDVVELFLQLGELVLQSVAVDGVVVGVGSGLHGDLAHSLEDLGGGTQSALGGLHQADGVLAVGGGLVQAADLSAHLLGNGQACGVVGGGVDGIARGELLNGRGDLAVVLGVLGEGVQRGKVCVNTHGCFLLDFPGPRPCSPA
ncbi:hypothetical protein SDC9_94995 [bioreactor metagenome]|uniref:Uncharacterized protein n=1 Tax=bioreactor metagenome TaxID=1076179 RepID=A0A645A7K8_9ZZZZ